MPPLIGELELDLIPTSYFFNVNRGNELLEQGVVPLFQAQMLALISTHAREPMLRKLARQALVRWRLGELIGERRGAVG